MRFTRLISSQKYLQKVSWHWELFLPHVSQLVTVCWSCGISNSFLRHLVIRLFSLIFMTFFGFIKLGFIFHSPWQWSSSYSSPKRSSLWWFVLDKFSTQKLWQQQFFSVINWNHFLKGKKKTVLFSHTQWRNFLTTTISNDNWERQIVSRHFDWGTLSNIFSWPSSQISTD